MHQTIKKNLGLPAQILKILVRMLNYRSNSEKPLNYQDLEEGGRVPPPTQGFRWISLITNMRCIFGFVNYGWPMTQAFSRVETKSDLWIYQRKCLRWRRLPDRQGSHPNAESWAEPVPKGRQRPSEQYFAVRGSRKCFPGSLGPRGNI